MKGKFEFTIQKRMTAVILFFLAALAVLSGRLIDRTLRPLFNHALRRDVQIVITVIAYDEESEPDFIALLAASTALAISPIPWNGPVGAVRVGLSSSGEFVLNPSYDFRESQNSRSDFMVCGRAGSINMIEVGAKEVSEDEAAEALKSALKEIDKLEKFQKKIIAGIGRAKIVLAAPKLPAELEKLFAEKFESRLESAVFAGASKSKKVEEFGQEWQESALPAASGADAGLLASHYEEKVNDLVHREVIERGRRPDGRGQDDIRPLFARAGGLSPILHGSGLFYRGGTHILSVLTLGSPKDAQIIDGMEVETVKRFMHHYNFPPFSSGEVGRMGGTNRRMIGHGALAEKALEPVIPAKETFPYTIRIVSEALSSNGSTSMGSVCASSLALMDAGVPIAAPVAGIAMGLMMKDEKHYKILTDIQGPEDHHGDMDFKVAGTRQGITAIQLDVKVNGVPLEILTEALEKAKVARSKILDVIEKEIAAPRSALNPNAPRIIMTRVRPDQIGLVIGSGGKTIKEIAERTGAEIEIEDDGAVYITGKGETAEKAKQAIEDLTKEYKPGERYEGVVTRILDFGAFVKIGPTAEGMVHISEVAPFRVDRITRFLKEGDKVPVVVKEIDEKNRINLSIKLADPNFVRNSK
ncbi:MAG: polyribonucleotide nucleotidyltransferase [Candidatus Taylorbacteria bacterium]|nr:polyribonucleotide nucleotidyltransferase [Candidatus Taylorbacteria bacterium]